MGFHALLSLFALPCQARIYVVTRNVDSIKAGVHFGVSRDDRTVWVSDEGIRMQSTVCAKLKPRHALACAHCLEVARESEYVLTCNNLLYLEDLVHILGACYFDTDQVENL
eukprot:12342277-Karenia_brevis.AAC.1